MLGTGQRNILIQSADWYNEGYLVKLADFPNSDIHEADARVYLKAISEGWGDTFKFKYPNYNSDPRPNILALGQYKHPTSGNDLIAGINLNYLDKPQIQQLRQAMPRFLRFKNLRQRYWAGRKLLPDLFASAYRTYNKDLVQAITPDKLQTFEKPKQPDRQADIDRQTELVKATQMLQKQQDQVTAHAKQHQHVEPDLPTQQDTDQEIQALQQQTAQQRQPIQPQPQKQQQNQPIATDNEPIAEPPAQANKIPQKTRKMAKTPLEKELEQEKNLPIEPEPEETLEGTPDNEQLKKEQELAKECRVMPFGVVWPNKQSYIKWHDPAMVGTVIRQLNETVLNSARGPVLMVKNNRTGQVVVDRAQDHAQLIADAGWSYKDVTRIMKCNNKVLAITESSIVNVTGLRSHGVPLLTEAAR